ncbi:hypothetical protein [Enterococcus sp. GC40]
MIFIFLTTIFVRRLRK